jgi:hypothetical protein
MAEGGEPVDIAVSLRPAGGDSPPHTSKKVNVLLHKGLSIKPQVLRYGYKYISNKLKTSTVHSQSTESQSRRRTTRDDDMKPFSSLALDTGPSA